MATEELVRLSPLAGDHSNDNWRPSESVILVRGLYYATFVLALCCYEKMTSFGTYTPSFLYFRLCVCGRVML